MIDYSIPMLKALELAERGTGLVSPNPRVGAIILDEKGDIIGEGWHKRFGSAHAEVDAIQNAGRESFVGCTLIVNLEPCSHFGKTPPCADLIIEKKFSKVIVGTLDANPAVSGLGVKKLENAGLEVIVGIEEEKCRHLNRAFFKYIQSQKPYVTLKVAQSIDGNIALQSGESKWITSPESRSLVQRLRAENDAILVGTSSIIADNPMLNVREINLPSPKRVILDSHLKLPLDLNIFHNQNENSSILFYNEENPTKIDLLNKMGITTEKIGLQSNGKLNLQQMIDILGMKYQITSILVEGGAEIYSAFLQEKLADEIHFFIAPKIIGGGKQSFNKFILNSLSDSPELEIIKFEQIGSDYHFESKIKYVH